MKDQTLLSRRKFEGEWDEIVYLYHKVLYWFYKCRNRSKAEKFCDRLEVLLRKIGNHDAILTEECWSLIYEVRRDFDKAIKFRESEIRLIKKLRRLKPRLDDYNAGDLADRFDLLATLYRDAGKLDKAIASLRKSREICRRAKIPFDGKDLMRDYLRLKKNK